MGLILKAEEIAKLLEYFAPHCKDKSTLNQLRKVAANPAQWKACYSLFQRIRGKTLRADRRSDKFHQHQYLFEEICAKALYNMSIHPVDYAFANPAPFDDDSADYVIPIAAQFADYVKIPQFDPNVLQQASSSSSASSIANRCADSRLTRFPKWIRVLLRFRDE